MKNIKFLIIFICVLSISYLITNSNNERHNLETNISHLDDNLEPNYKSKKKKIRPINKKINIDLANKDLIRLLKPPQDLDLESVWSEEYGCFEYEYENSCEYDFLNAKSLKEAKWMKNNGYPSKSMLNLVSSPKYQNQIKELAKSKYPAALTVSSIEAMRLGNYREAAHLALSTIAYSDKSKTYPHVLYAEALILDDKTIAGVTQLFIAAMLGDSMANGRSIGLSPNAAYTTTTINSAHNYLNNNFGLDVPKDPRPIGEGDG